jgi:hypothetical protein
MLQTGLPCHCALLHETASEGGDAVGGRLPRGDAVRTCGVETNVLEKHTFSIFWSELQPWRWKQSVPPKYWSLLTNRCGITTHTIFIAMCFVILCAVILRPVLFSLFWIESFVIQSHDLTMLLHEWIYCVVKVTDGGTAHIVLVHLIFKTLLINKPWNEIWARELCRYHSNWKKII